MSVMEYELIPDGTMMLMPAPEIVKIAGTWDLPRAGVVQNAKIDGKAGKISVNDGPIVKWARVKSGDDIKGYPEGVTL